MIHTEAGQLQVGVELGVTLSLSVSLVHWASGEGHRLLSLRQRRIHHWQKLELPCQGGIHRHDGKKEVA